jgi:hypothetical protein
MRGFSLTTGCFKVACLNRQPSGKRRFKGAVKIKNKIEVIKNECF